MIKTGKVEIGSTPADNISGPCDAIVDGEPVANGYIPEKSIEKSARLLDPDEESGINNERK
jgi:hypothetical protein